MTRLFWALLFVLFPALQAKADLMTVNLFEDGPNVVMQWQGAFDVDNLGAPTNTHTLAHQYVDDGAHRSIYAFGGGTVDSWIDPDLNNAFIPDFMTTDGIRNADLISGFRWGILDHDVGLANNGELYIQNGYVSGTNVSGQMTWLNTDFATLGFVDTSGTFTYGDDDSIFINVSAAGATSVPEPSTAFLFLFAGSALMVSRCRGKRGGMG